MLLNDHPPLPGTRHVERVEDVVRPVGDERRDEFAPVGYQAHRLPGKEVRVGIGG